MIFLLPLLEGKLLDWSELVCFEGNGITGDRYNQQAPQNNS
jgi:hypothetical protein